MHFKVFKAGVDSLFASYLIVYFLSIERMRSRPNGVS